MFIDFLSESCEKGGISRLGNEDEPIFRGYALPNQPELIGFGMPLFYLVIFGKCIPGSYCNDF